MLGNVEMAIELLCNVEMTSFPSPDSHASHLFRVIYKFVQLCFFVLGNCSMLLSQEMLYIVNDTFIATIE